VTGTLNVGGWSGLRDAATPTRDRTLRGLAGPNSGESGRPAALSSYGTTELTEVPQLANPSLVPPQVPSVSVNAVPVQFGD
jgi:hypothetical protein